MDELDEFASDLEHDQLVVIQTEDDSPPIKIPKSILCKASKYFVKALEGGFKESMDYRLVLPGCEYESAKLLAYWLYHNKLPNFKQEVRNLDVVDIDTRIVHLAHLWMLADRILMLKLQNATMAQLLHITGDTFTSASSIRDVYLLAAKGSMLWKAFMVEAQYECFEGVLLDEELEDLGEIPGFLADLTTTTREILEYSYGRKRRILTAREYGMDKFKVNEEEPGDQDV